MRSLRTMGGLVLLLALVGACDTTQPLQVDQETFALRALGVSGQAKTYNVYDGYEDLDNDNVLDSGEPTFLFCTTNNDGASVVSPNSIPWNFSLQISVLRAGTDQPEVITSSAALGATGNQTEYDTSVPTKPAASQLPITVDGRTFRFLNKRLRSSVNYAVLQATTNPLYVLRPTTYGLGNGRCSDGDPGPASIDGEQSPVTFELGKGDTVIVEFRRTGMPAGLNASLIDSAPQVRLSLSRNGTDLLENADMTTTVTQDGVSYSYTSN